MCRPAPYALHVMAIAAQPYRSQACMSLNRIKASHICNGVLRNVLEQDLSCKFSQKLHRRMASMFHGIPGKQHLRSSSAGVLLHSHPG